MVAKLDNNHDWTFGEFLIGKEEIKQNILTRIKSFANDWFLDEKANIDWVGLLGSTNQRAKSIIKAEIIRVTKNTKGVIGVDFVEMDLDRVSRELKIHIKYTDVYGINELNIRVSNDNN
ncbi:MAG: hypothetical protein LBG21_02965 [Campylobacteraceae bacterium]|jgi:hypothetical protein|nr:hypothetical protein [Campylobacteraceae bacterium]